MRKHKTYPWRCAECKKLEVYRCVIKNYHVKIGNKEAIIPEFSVAKCNSCGALHIDISADEQIQKAIKEKYCD